MLKISENNRTKKIGLVTPTPALQRRSCTWVLSEYLLGNRDEVTVQGLFVLFFVFCGVCLVFVFVLLPGGLH